MKQKLNGIPKHIGIILDGNRRFAKKLMLKPWKGHEWGAKKVRKFLRWCQDAGIKEVTLYTFSLENFNRPKKEFNYLMNLFKKEFTNLLTDKEIEDDKVRIRFVGRIYLLPKALQKVVKKVEEKTKNYSNLKVNIAIAYSGRAEIVDALNKIVKKIKQGKLPGKNITEKEIEKNLYLSAEPDFIIRTSGEQRTSGFLLWQASYSELYFSPKFWPEFEKKDLIKALNSYAQRQRRFGR
ncbi:di-trans,poly-cis-decaprenylcistransferase [Candidatus Pacearchaeota archaeon ex4484_26]|nr:MAG: di-trans,poly-cis-decaprenylcistransferase [Candidatus Pacearchaeota archaeon ex4484_26]